MVRSACRVNLSRLDSGALHKVNLSTRHNGLIVLSRIEATTEMYNSRLSLFLGDILPSRPLNNPDSLPSYSYNNTATTTLDFTASATLHANPVR